MELIIITELISELMFDYWVHLMVIINSLFLADIYGRIL